jgi:hypothetical protein
LRFSPIGEILDSTSNKPGEQMTKKEKQELKQSINEQVIHKLLTLAENTPEYDDVKKLAVFFEMLNEMPVKKNNKPKPSL